jgi:hypothetical protein
VEVCAQNDAHLGSAPTDKPTLLPGHQDHQTYGHAKMKKGLNASQAPLALILAIIVRE